MYRSRRLAAVMAVTGIWWGNRTGLLAENNWYQVRVRPGEALYVDSGEIVSGKPAKGRPSLFYKTVRYRPLNNEGEKRESIIILREAGDEEGDRSTNGKNAQRRIRLSHSESQRGTALPVGKYCYQCGNLVVCPLLDYNINHEAGKNELMVTVFETDGIVHSP